MAFAAHAMSVVESVLLKGGLGDPWSATEALVAEDRKASKPRPSSAANAKPARPASEALLTRAAARPSSAPSRKALSEEQLAESSDPLPRAPRRSRRVSQQDKCTERLMVVQIHKLPDHHVNFQRHHMRAEERRQNVRPPSATQTQPRPIVGLPLLRAASLRRNAACQPRPACASIVRPSASRVPAAASRWQEARRQAPGCRAEEPQARLHAARRGQGRRGHERGHLRDHRWG